MAIIKGQGNLRRTLAKLPEDIRKLVADALKQSAEDIFNDAQSLVPKNTGLLAKNMHIKKGSRGLSYQIGYWKKGNIRKWRKAGFRAKFIEFGVRGRAAQPFMAPAWRKNEQKAFKRINDAVDLALEKASNL